MTVATLTAQAQLTGAEFGRYAARATALDPRVQDYALAANAHRSNSETVAILSSLLNTALRPEPGYRLPVPALLVHGDHDRIGDIATADAGLGGTGAAGRVRRDHRGGARQQPRQSRGVHRGPARVSSAGPRR
jgi:hypothetical protein